MAKKEQTDLFESLRSTGVEERKDEAVPQSSGTSRPLALRMRPRRLQEVLGQEHLLGPGPVARIGKKADQVRQTGPDAAWLSR